MFDVILFLFQNFPDLDLDITQIIRTAVELREPRKTSKPPTGKSQSERGINLKQRLSLKFS